MTARIHSPYSHHAPRRIACALVLLAVAVAALAPAYAAAADFNPLMIISDDNWRASGSMTQADIQAFLVAQNSVLWNYSGPEGGPNGTHSQAIKPASQIIAEACQYWGINPKLIIATLEKEQSLISQSWHAGTYNGPYVATPGVPSCPGDHGTGYHITNAMGVGCYKGSPDTHPGFGDQVWTGAQKLASPPPAGLSTSSPYYWYPGRQMTPSGSPNPPGYIVPLNQPTWNLYKYTPYYPQYNVWKYYVKYFGDPLAAPEHRPVYRFYNLVNGTHFYTVSDGERWMVITKLGKTYRFEGPAYSVDTSATSTNKVPLYRFYNRRNGSHFYTANEAESINVQLNMRSTYTFEGQAYMVSQSPTATQVFRFYNKKAGSHFYTASEQERDTVQRTLGWKYTYEGPAFSVQQN